MSTWLDLTDWFISMAEKDGAGGGWGRDLSQEVILQARYVFLGFRVLLNT